jgi:Amt family ammonium transporter
VAEKVRKCQQPCEVLTKTAYYCHIGYGFNPGSALLLAHTSDTGFVASRAAVNTSLSAAAGAVSALMTNMFMEERSTGEYSFNIIMAMNGALAGLVSITAACGTVQNWAALCIGCIGGLIYLWGSKTLVRLKLDDAVDAIPVHMFAGGWGLLAVGLFSDPALMHIAYGTGNHPGLLYSWGLGEFNAILLSNQVLELVFVAGWAFGTMTPFFLFINRMGWFRSDSLEELVGLDEAYHGGKHGGEEVVELSALEGFIKNKIRQSQIRSPYN